MENIIIDQKQKIHNLEEENEALKKKIVLMYQNWDFDNKKYQELKEQVKKS
jgi:hypothetical protein